MRDPSQATVFLPIIQKALTVELHRLASVCQPSQAQFDSIIRAGQEAVSRTAVRYWELQQARQPHELWPRPGEAIAEALQSAVNQSLPADSAERYRQEREWSREAAIAGDVAAIVNLIDRRAVLEPTVHEQLSEHLQQHWQSHWSRRNVVLLYPQYAQLPEPEVLAPFLTEQQRLLWADRPPRRDVRLSWQVHLGTLDPFDSVQLRPVDLSQLPGNELEAK